MQVQGDTHLTRMVAGGGRVQDLAGNKCVGSACLAQTGAQTGAQIGSTHVVVSEFLAGDPFALLVPTCRTCSTASTLVGHWERHAVALC